MNLNNQNQI